MLAQMKRYGKNLQYPVRSYAAFVSEDGNIQFYDFIQKLEDPSIPVSECGPTAILPYGFIRIGAQNRRADVQRKKEKRYINGLRVVC